MDENEIKNQSQRNIKGELTEKEKEALEARYFEIGLDAPLLSDETIAKHREAIFKKVTGDRAKKFLMVFCWRLPLLRLSWFLLFSCSYFIKVILL
ncbi:hypothetical protein ACRQ5D_34375 [Mucilaginibacter sp. P25]|uniref:hypothetical protein n=1 Tax=Mucilaginibacter sp. P25 TaxID=3423945 RepID=UPI003D7BC73B